MSALNEDALQELVALRELKPSLKIGDLLEHDTPQEGAMSRLPFQRGVWEGKGRLGGRKALLSSRVAPPSSRNQC